MATATNSTPPGAFSRRFLATAAARVSTFAAAGEPFSAAGFRGATVGPLRRILSLSAVPGIGLSLSLGGFGLKAGLPEHARSLTWVQPGLLPCRIPMLRSDAASSPVVSLPRRRGSSPMSKDTERPTPYRLMLPNGAESPTDAARHIADGRRDRRSGSFE